MRRSNRRGHASGATGEPCAIVPELVLNVQADGRLLIHVLTDSHVQRLGLFDQIADAWAAVDEVDASSNAY